MHGSPRINICHHCKKYVSVPRFDEDPDCPTCGKKSKGTWEEKMIEEYKLPEDYVFKLSFGRWQKI